MAAVTNGAELVRKLKESGTPNQRLAAARAILTRVRDDRNEVANAAQVIAALEGKYGPDHMTVVKAKAIARDGVWVPPSKEQPVVAVEEELLATPGTVSTAAPAEVEQPRRGRTRKAVATKQIQDAEPIGT